MLFDRNHRKEWNASRRGLSYVQAAETGGHSRQEVRAAEADSELERLDNDNELERLDREIVKRALEAEIGKEWLDSEQEFVIP
jgi:hypothetical protein